MKGNAGILVFISSQQPSNIFMQTADLYSVPHTQGQATNTSEIIHAIRSEKLFTACRKATENAMC